jgi:hypothetical protein
MPKTKRQSSKSKIRRENCARVPEIKRTPRTNIRQKRRLTPTTYSSSIHQRKMRKNKKLGETADRGQNAGIWVLRTEYSDPGSDTVAVSLTVFSDYTLPRVVV